MNIKKPAVKKKINKKNRENYCGQFLAHVSGNISAFKTNAINILNRINRNRPIKANQYSSKVSYYNCQKLNCFIKKYLKKNQKTTINLNNLFGNNLS